MFLLTDVFNLTGNPVLSDSSDVQWYIGLYDELDDVSFKWADETSFIYR